MTDFWDGAVWRADGDIDVDGWDGSHGQETMIIVDGVIRGMGGLLVPALLEQVTVVW